jgi:hypothetical protein
MLVIFPSDPFETYKPDPDYAEEVQVAKDHGHEVAFMHYESLVNDGDAAQAVKRVPDFEEPVPAIYRGWMLTTEQYERLYAALQVCCVDLPTPASYRAAHHLPSWYAALEEYTPDTAFLPKQDVTVETATALVKQVLQSCEHGVIVKDYVKSRKHEWEEACFIPDESKAQEVVTNFLERQGSDLQGGFVVREYVPLKEIGKHPQSGMPMAEEVRIFWLNGQCAVVSEYWPTDFYEEGVEPVLDTLPDPNELAEVAGLVKSSFITMDMARDEAGEWLVVEVGDGQVSGFPRGRRDAEIFYQRLAEITQPKGIAPDAAPITQMDFDGMTCAQEGCDHKGHSTEMVLHPRCHVGSPTWAVYQDGVLNVKCSTCGTLVVRIAVDPGAVTKH